MARHVQIIAPANVSEAYERLGLDTLQPLAKLIAGDAPKRKSDLVPYLSRLMSQPEEIRRLYDSLGEVSKAAIQEALADPAGKLDLDRFIAKYGQRPDLGGYSSASRLQLFLPFDRSIPEDLRLILRDFVPEPREVTISSLVSFSRLNTEFAPPGRNGSARNSSTSSSGSRRSKESKARLNAAADRRSSVSDVLAECPIDRWIAIDEFFRLLKASGEDFAVARIEWKLYVAEYRYSYFDDRGRDSTRTDCREKDVESAGEPRCRLERAKSRSGRYAVSGARCRADLGPGSAP